MPKQIKKVLYGAWEILEVVFVAVVTVFIIRTFLVQPFLVSGASMEQSFFDGDYLLVDEITYRFREPMRGEVIVFHYPFNRDLYFIKRIIGMPGEKVVARNGTLSIVRGKEEIILNEDYLVGNVRPNDNFEIQLSQGDYFVLGDNRFQSFDSRVWGAVKRSDIVGLTRLRVLPIRTFGAFEAPVY